MCSEQSFYVIVIKAWWKETPSANSLLYLCAPAAIIMDIMTTSRSGNSQGGSKQTNGRNVPCPLSSPANTNPATIRTFQIMGTPACSLILRSIPRRETHNNNNDNNRRGEADNKQDYTQSNKEIDKVWKKWFYQEYQGPLWDVPSLWVWFGVCMYYVPCTTPVTLGNE